MKKFTFAYVPKKKSKEFLDLCNRQNIETETYCLGKDSMPHVTLCQFLSYDDALSKMWEAAKKIIEKKIINLNFKEISHLSFDKSIYWISVLPSETRELFNAFESIKKIVNPLRKDTYDPHLTLCNYKDNNPKEFISLVNKSLPISDEFEIILGESDKVGQLKSIIYRHEAEGLEHNYKIQF